MSLGLHAPIRETRLGAGLVPLIRTSWMLLPPALVWLVGKDRHDRWLVMWAMAFAMYLGAKVVALLSRRTNWLDVLNVIGFVVATPGMDWDAFVRRSARPLAWRRDALASLVCAMMGAGMFWGAPRLVPQSHSDWIAWLGMCGAVLMLHFGALRLITCGWRALGREVRPLMLLPLQSASVAEFWGRRWNTAFRDLSAKAWFQPLAKKHGTAAATWLTFALSGFVHDLIISVPAGGGYGLPTGYFLWQAAVIQWEHSRWGKRIYAMFPPLRRIIAWLTVLLPAGVLFHGPFRQEIVLPFMKALGAL